MSKRCNCSDERADNGFDAKAGYEHLSRKYTQLADVVAKYVSQAGLKRSERVDNAMAMAEVLMRIVGGTETTGYPECCLLGRETLGGTRRWSCTGVLVHPRIVLTAAHCRNTLNLVAVNSHNQDVLQEANIIRVKRVHIHPGYNRLNDISVLILQSPAPANPVGIATTQEISAATDTTLVGFGNNDIYSTVGFGIKREVEVPITYLRRDPQDNLDDAEFQYGFESDLEFVAGGNGFDSCNGDSGGPAYIAGADGQRKVAGLTSRGFESSANPCGDGGIYTRVDAHLDFIRQVAQENSINF